MKVLPLPRLATLAAASLLSAILAGPTSGQDKNGPAAGPEKSEAELEKEYQAALEKIGWVRQGKGVLKKWAEIDIPPGFRFTPNASDMLKFTGNIPGDNECGVIGTEDLNWWVLFRFDEIGYVKDDEKDEIDADKLLKQERSFEKESNEMRRERGLDELFIEGWAKEPFYNEETNNLEWALLLRSSSGSTTVNYNSKNLGRKGVMDVVLLCDPEDLDATLPQFQSLMRGFRFQQGETYAEYKSGDKLAKIGLTALIVGGGAAVAAKTGLLAAFFKFFGKLGKAAYLLVAGVVAGIVNAFKRLFGRGQ